MTRRRQGRTSRKRHSQERTSFACSHEKWSVNLLRWMKSYHFQCKLSPADFKDTGRGLQTKTAIKPGTTLISVPSSLLITTATVLHSDIGHHIKKWSPKLTPQQCLTIFLVWEKQKGPSSSWKPYMDSLPHKFSTPAYFSAKELSFLPKSVKVKAAVECQKIQQKFIEIQRHAKYHWEEFYKKFDYDMFRWAWFAINTRSVYLQRDTSVYLSEEEDDNIALAPFLDLLNHFPDAKITAGFDRITNSYEIITHDAYRPYDQVFISYGCHGNRHLAIEYGFCVQDNPQSEVQFEYDDVIDACKQFNCTMIEEKVELLRENSMLKSLTCCTEGLTWNFWIVLKTLAMKYRHLKVWHEIYMGNEAFGDIVETARSMAKYLLNLYLKENKQQISYVDKNVSDCDSKDHVSLCRALLAEEKAILQTSLINLDHNFFR